MKYSVLTFKSTRGFKLLEGDLTWEEALASLDVWYAKSVLFAKHDLMASGVSIMIATEEDAEGLVIDYDIPFWPKILFQAGGC